MGIIDESAGFQKAKVSLLDSKESQIDYINSEENAINTDDFLMSTEEVKPRSVVRRSEPPIRRPVLKREEKLEVTFQDFYKRAMKYVFIFLVIVFAVKFFSDDALDYTRAFKIAAVAAITFALLDMYAPSISLGAGIGAGWALGQGAVGTI
jgi:hypothetical protein